VESHIKNFAGSAVQVLNTNCRGSFDNPFNLHLHQAGVQALNKSEGTSIDGIGAVDDSVIAHEVIAIDRETNTGAMVLGNPMPVRTYQFEDRHYA